MDPQEEYFIANEGDFIGDDGDCPCIYYHCTENHMATSEKVAILQNNKLAERVLKMLNKELCK